MSKKESALGLNQNRGKEYGPIQLVDKHSSRRLLYLGLTLANIALTLISRASLKQKQHNKDSIVNPIHTTIYNPTFPSVTLNRRHAPRHKTH